MTCSEVDRLRDLVASGMSTRAAAVRLGINPQTAYRRLNPEAYRRQLAANEARRLASKHPCPDGCGRMVDAKWVRCHECESRRRGEQGWTRAKVAAAMRRYFDLFGEPPTVLAWDPSSWWRAPGWRDEYRRRWEREAWPHTVTVQMVCGSWNAAIEASGFIKLPDDGSGPAVRRWMLEEGTTREREAV